MMFGGYNNQITDTGLIGGTLATNSQVATPDPIESQVTGLYQTALDWSNRSTNAFNSWQSMIGAAGATGYQAYLSYNQAAKMTKQAASVQAGTMQMAASQAGFSADAMYTEQQNQMAQQQRNAEMQVGNMKTAVAGSGWTTAGSPQLLMDESVNQSMLQEQYTQLGLARQEQALRQQQQNLVQQSDVTVQAGNQQANLLATQGFNTWYTSQLRGAI